MTPTEPSRLQAVRKFEDIDFNLNTSLLGILRLISEIYDTPVAFITLIDEHDQWFKVKRGFDVFSMPRHTSFCTHAISQDGAMVVPDATLDERFNDNPLVKGAPNIRFYAGAPLASSSGHNIGTLCVMDMQAHEVNETKRVHLEILAKQAIHLMELELTYKLLREKIEQVEIQNKALSEIAFIQSHEFRGPVTSIMGLMNIMREEEYQSPREYLELMEGAIKTLDEKIHMVVRSANIARNTYVA